MGSCQSPDVNDFGTGLYCSGTNNFIALGSEDLRGSAWFSGGKEYERGTIENSRPVNCLGGGGGGGMRILHKLNP